MDDRIGTEGNGIGRFRRIWNPQVGPDYQPLALQHAKHAARGIHGAEQGLGKRNILITLSECLIWGVSDKCS